MSKYMYTGTTVCGCTAQDGRRYYIFKDRDKTAEWLADRQAMLSDPKGMIQSLSAQGMAIGGAAHVTELVELARRVSDYPRREVLARTGWNGACCARADGKIFLPELSSSIAPPPAIGFRREPGRYLCSGKLGDWKRRVATPLGKDAAANFVFGLALAPSIRPLLKRTIAPFTVQLIAEERSELRGALLSVIGSASDSKLAADPIGELLAQPSRLIDGSRDSLLFLGDVNAYLCGEVSKKRPASLLASLNDHLLPSGGGDASPAGGAVPCVLLIESEPLAVQLGLAGSSAARLEEAIITIKLRVGALDGCRNGLERDSTSARVWSGVLSAMTEHHGVALRCFQQRLVEHRADVGPMIFEAELNADFDEFCRCFEEIDDGSVPDAMVEMFALTNAALMAAERLKVLPEELEHPRSEAVWRVFRHAMADRPRQLTAADILTKIAGRTVVRKINDLQEGDGKDELDNVPAFVKVKKDGSRELWVPTTQKKELFDWRAFQLLHDYREWYCGKGEADRDGEKRRLGGWKTRVLRFRLP